MTQKMRTLTHFGEDIPAEKQRLIQGDRDTLRSERKNRIGKKRGMLRARNKNKYRLLWSSTRLCERDFFAPSMENKVWWDTNARVFGHAKSMNASCEKIWPQIVLPCCTRKKERKTAFWKIELERICKMSRKHEKEKLRKTKLQMRLLCVRVYLLLPVPRFISTLTIFSICVFSWKYFLPRAFTVRCF